MQLKWQATTGKPGWQETGGGAEGQTETGRENEAANEDAPSGCRRIYHGCRQAPAASAAAAAAAEGRDLDRICRRSGYLRGADF